MAAFLIDGYLLAYVRIYGVPDFADDMSTIVFPLGWVTKPGRAVSAEPLCWCSWFVLSPELVEQSPLCCSLGLSPFVLGTRLVEQSRCVALLAFLPLYWDQDWSSNPAEMLCWLFSLCTGTKTGRAVSAEMLLPSAPTQATAVLNWTRGPADQVFCQVLLYFLLRPARYVFGAGVRGPRSTPSSTVTRSRSFPTPGHIGTSHEYVNHQCDGKSRGSFRISIPAFVHLVLYLSASGHTTGIMMLPGSAVSHTALAPTVRLRVFHLFPQEVTSNSSPSFRLLVLMKELDGKVQKLTFSNSVRSFNLFLASANLKVYPSRWSCSHYGFAADYLQFRPCHPRENCP